MQSLFNWGDVLHVRLGVNPCAALLFEKIAHFQIGNYLIPFSKTDLIFGWALEVVSKPQIRLKSKAQTDEKAQSRQRRDEQYILKRLAT